MQDEARALARDILRDQQAESMYNSFNREKILNIIENIDKYSKKEFLDLMSVHEAEIHIPSKILEYLWDDKNLEID